MNIYGSQELTPGNYSVSLTVAKDDSTLYYPLTIEFRTLDGEIFAQVLIIII